MSSVHGNSTTTMMTEDSHNGGVIVPQVYGRSTSKEGEGDMTHHQKLPRKLM